MSWRPEANDGSGWGRNGLVFATKEESDAWGADLMMRWLACREVRSVETDEPPTHQMRRVSDGHLWEIRRLD